MMASRGDAAGVARVLAARRAREAVEAPPAPRLPVVRRLEPDARPEPKPEAPREEPEPGRVLAIVEAVAFEMGLRVDAILDRVKPHALIRPRAAVAWLARRTTRLSLPQIGVALGGRHHTTILYLVAKAEGLRDRDPAFRRLTDKLRARFAEDVA